MQQSSHKNKGLVSISAVVIAIMFISGLSLSLEARGEPFTITVWPTVPKEGMPVLITLSLNNPGGAEDFASYELYANGALVTQGTVVVPGGSTKMYTYTLPNGPGLGERLTLLLKTESGQGGFEKTVSTPAYPPQVWSSFVSFASFSTSLMGSSMGSSMGSTLTSMQSYKNSFTDNAVLNTGFLFSLVLIALLVFLELTEPIHLKGFHIKGLRTRFGRLSAILFIVFIGMVLTKVVMIVG